MSTRIQEALSSAYQSTVRFVSSAASWIGKTVTAGAQAISATASKVAAFAQPHFQSMAAFAKANKQTIGVATVGFVAGAAALALFQRVCCKSKSECV